jgi:hypothetical protein
MKLTKAEVKATLEALNAVIGLNGSADPTQDSARRKLVDELEHLDARESGRRDRSKR